MYSTVRCAVFHTKSAEGRALQLGTLANHDLAVHQLLALLVYFLVKK
jgi:hypothetical protein